MISNNNNNKKKMLRNLQQTAGTNAAASLVSPGLWYVWPMVRDTSEKNILIVNSEW